MNVRKFIKDIEIEDIKLIVRIMIIILLMILIIITSFNAGKKFYYLKSTFSENKNIECKGKIAKWKFDAKINLYNEELNDEKLYSEWLYDEELNSENTSTENIKSQDENSKYITYTINAYKLTLDTNNTKKTPSKERENIQPMENKIINQDVNKDNAKTPEVSYNVQKRNNNEGEKEDNKDTFIIIKK